MNILPNIMHLVNVFLKIEPLDKSYFCFLLNVPELVNEGNCNLLWLLGNFIFFINYIKRNYFKFKPINLFLTDSQFIISWFKFRTVSLNIVLWKKMRLSNKNTSYYHIPTHYHILCHAGTSGTTGPIFVIEESMKRSQCVGKIYIGPQGCILSL